MTIVSAGCAKGAHGPTAAPSYSGVGFVRVEDAVRRHPLYPQLTQYDEEIAVLEGSGAAAPPVDPAELRKREKQLEQSLAAASADAKAELARLQQRYEQQEREVIAAALHSAGVMPSANAGGDVVQGVAANFQAQAKAVTQRAQQSFDAYRAQVVAQDRAQLDAEAKRLAEEADRKYRDKAHDLNAAEEQLAQQLAQKSAAERLEIRTKLQNLALDDADRKQLEAQLEALNQADADQIAQMRNRDQQTLQAYQQQLRSEVQTRMQAYAAQVHRDTNAKLEQRAGVEREAVQKQVQALAPQVNQQLSGFDVSKLTPDLRARIESIHQDFLRRYQADAQGEVERFNKTRDELSRRYAALNGAVGAADAETAKEIERLQHDRDQLYQKIVGQIEAAARQIGQARGLRVVLGGAIAGGTGVDLTGDVEHDLEKSHA